MKKILVLIKKDISFNLLIYLGIYLVTSLLILAAALGFDGSEATDTLNYLVYTCCVSIIIVPFSYNIEDDFSTRKFISTLPVSMHQILMAKLLLGAMFSALFSGTAWMIFAVLGKAILFRCVLIPVMLSIAMASFFMLAFYKWDMNIARIVAVAPIVFFATAAKTLDKLNIVGDLFSIKLLLIAFIIVILASILTERVTLQLVK